MKLILFRHGLAESREDFISKNLDDSLRPLVEKGKKNTRRAAEHLARHVDRIDFLVSSPWLRAQQTAKIIADVVPHDRYLESQELIATAPPQAFANWLKTHAAHVTSVCAVGHEPQLSVFASWLLGGQSQSFLDLKKSGTLLLEIESFEHLGPRCADLKWLVSPKIY